MRALLSLAHCHGDVLGTSWYMVLQTLQHLTVILGLKFSASGSLKGIQANDLPSLVCSDPLPNVLRYFLVNKFVVKFTDSIYRQVKCSNKHARLCSVCTGTNLRAFGRARLS